MSAGPRSLHLEVTLGGSRFIWIGLVSSETRMKPEEILRIVDAIHRDKNIDKEIVFQAIESALVTALLRHYYHTVLNSHGSKNIIIFRVH